MMRIEGKANQDDVDKIWLSKANREDIEMLANQLKDLEKQINFLEDDNNEEIEHQENDSVKKTNMNMYGYGDDFYPIIRRDLEEKKVPNVRKLVKYLQTQINDMCGDMEKEKDIWMNMTKELVGIWDIQAD